jgi:sugar phosphate isomerase/epimerase
MYQCLNPGAVGVSLPWDACLSLARDNGFEGIDISLDPGVPAERFRDGLARFGLKPGGAGLPLRVTEDAAAFSSQVRALPSVARQAQAVGVTRFTTWILSFSDRLPWKENFRLHAMQLGEAARILEDHGCRLGLEFLGPRSIREGHRHGFISTLEQMLELCEEAGPNVGLLLDAWHWYTSLGIVEQVRCLDNRQVVYVHINDAPAGIPIEKQQDQVRCLPGESGVIDLAGFLGALREIRYDGPVVPEPFVKELSAMAPTDAVARVARALKRVWALGGA